ncbi:hypothetical protein EJ05DRAFT_515693 [Pseudovirgaria hyperparasitica]|uniref:Uncharacterized protein n=1 Tax=Pseudovirgaria hyperparasitica TaxID=470096 RepID=A0A6A6VSZ5_9PEZI|nr:uncharacterized protein EJ05DRAFT_515693 [Pseudovirgaria hyperparasitica]KAF2752367.1 hypothetical protein EJ05DRAFT_515693 [Pseudovirgaria hyperparasitica]
MRGWPSALLIIVVTVLGLNLLLQNLNLLEILNFEAILLLILVAFIPILALSWVVFNYILGVITRLRWEDGHGHDGRERSEV